MITAAGGRRRPEKNKGRGSILTYMIIEAGEKRLSEEKNNMIYMIIAVGGRRRPEKSNRRGSI
jgi:hypothetical protein